MSFQRIHRRKLDLASGLPRKDFGGEVSSNSRELVIALLSAPIAGAMLRASEVVHM